MEVSHKETEWNKWSLRREISFARKPFPVVLEFLDVSNVTAESLLSRMSVEDRLDEDLKKCR